jgi:hypothetical protein
MFSHGLNLRIQTHTADLCNNLNTRFNLPSFSLKFSLKFSLNPNIKLLTFSLKPLNDQFNTTTTITGLGLQTNKNNKRLLRATNSLILATTLMTTTTTMANQKARIGMTMTTAMITAMMATNKSNASSMYPEPNSQPNLLIHFLFT